MCGLRESGKPQESQVRPQDPPVFRPGQPGWAPPAPQAQTKVEQGSARRTIVDKFVDNLAALVESRMPQRTQVKLKVMRGKQVKLNISQRTQVETSFRLELHWSATGAHWS